MWRGEVGTRSVGNEKSGFNERPTLVTLMTSPGARFPSVEGENQPSHALTDPTVARFSGDFPPNAELTSKSGHRQQLQRRFFCRLHSVS